jgi:hypothetical protein
MSITKLIRKGLVRSHLSILGWFGLGAASCACAIGWYLCGHQIKIVPDLSMMGLIQIVITCTLALYIPWVVDRSKRRDESVCESLTGELQEFLEIGKTISGTLTECLGANKTVAKDKRLIKSKFMSMNLKLTVVAENIKGELGTGAARELAAVEATYHAFWQIVTDGDLYGAKGRVDSRLERDQQIQFSKLESCVGKLSRRVRKRH